MVKYKVSMYKSQMPCYLANLVLLVDDRYHEKFTDNGVTHVPQNVCLTTSSGSGGNI